MNKHLLLIFLSLSFILTSCNSFYEEGIDCAPKYIVKLKYDHNIKFADAFSNEVNSVTMYLFDTLNRLSKQQTFSKSDLTNNYNSFLLEAAPGNYKLVIWANSHNNNSFAIAPTKQGDITINDLTCYLKRNSPTENIEVKAPLSQPYVNQDLTPIYHCFINNLNLSSKQGDYIIQAPLTKITNTFRITIQHLSSKQLNISDFNFSIEADNGHLNYNNSLLPDEIISYKPWHITTASAQAENQQNKNINLSTAEITTSRLVEGHNAKLTITNKEDKTILSLPLIDYILLTKGNYRKAMSNQEYLDRQDEYNITLFLDENNEWLNTRIIINGWVITNSTSALGK